LLKLGIVIQLAREQKGHRLKYCSPSRKEWQALRVSMPGSLQGGLGKI